MSITFGQGIQIGSGISFVPSDLGNGLAFDPAYLGAALELEWANLSVFDNYPGQYVGLTNTALNLGQKYIISWCVSYSTDPANLIGLANRSVDLNNYLGADANGLGFGQDGNLYYGNTSIFTDLPTWGTIGDCVDIAVDLVNNTIWIRVNGGDWNGNPANDPATNVGGAPILDTSLRYPAVCIGGFNGPTELSINSAPIYSVPSGFNFVGTGWPAFVFTSERADSAGSFDGDYSDVTTSGYTLNSPADVYSAYYVHVPGSDADIINAFTQAGMTPWSAGYMWYTNWGPGTNASNPASGVSHIAYSQGGKELYIVAFNPDPTTQWQTPGSYGEAATGTYRFPVVCTAIIPTIEKSGWC